MAGHIVVSMYMCMYMHMSDPLKTKHTGMSNKIIVKHCMVKAIQSD